MISYFPCNYFHKNKALKHAAHVRLLSLASFIKNLPGGKVIPVWDLSFEDLSRLFIFLRKLARDENRFILFSYPNFPFFAPTFEGFLFFKLFLFLLNKIVKQKGKKIIIDVDDLPSYDDEYCKNLRRGVRKRLLAEEKMLFNSADILWVMTETQARIMNELFGIAPKNFIVVPNGNIRSESKPAIRRDDKIRLVYAGSFIWQGIREMVTSFSKLKEKNAELYLLGSGYNPIKIQVNDPRIKFLGELDHHSCEEIIRSCDIGILPYDPHNKYYAIAHPAKLSLYITCEIPIITTDVKNIAKIVKEKQIGLVSPFPDMSAAMETLVKDSHLRKTFSANCAKIKEDYYFDTILCKALKQSLEKLTKMI